MCILWLSKQLLFGFSTISTAAVSTVLWMKISLCFLTFWQLPKGFSGRIHKLFHTRSLGIFSPFGHAATYILYHGMANKQRIIYIF